MEPRQSSSADSPALKTSARPNATSLLSMVAPPAAREETESCSPCRELLRLVMERSESRPRSLLASMNSMLEWRATENGVQVKIPTEASRPTVPLHRRRWSRVQPSQESSGVGLPEFSSGPLVQATSSLDTSLSETHAIKTQFSQQQQTKENLPSPVSPHLVDTRGNEAATTITKKKGSAQATEWMNVSCDICPTTGPKGKARAYVNGPSPLDIVVCANRLRGVSSADRLAEMEEILTHELVHVYDARQLQLDLRQCENLAYSEVRAAREAECRHITWGKTSCVRERALLATKNLFPLEASRTCLQRVFATAMADVRPVEGGGGGRQPVKVTGAINPGNVWGHHTGTSRR